MPGMKIKTTNDVRQLVQESGISALRLSKGSGVPYASVHGFVYGDADPRFSTVLRLLDAAGFDVSVKRRSNRKE